MKELKNLKSNICDELEKIDRKGALSAGDLETAHKLTATMKGLLEVEEMEGGEPDGVSHRGGRWEANGSYGNGRSYANRGQHYVRGHYSHDDGTRRELMERLEDMMTQATGPDRESYRMALDALRS